MSGVVRFSPVTMAGQNWTEHLPQAYTSSLVLAGNSKTVVITPISPDPLPFVVGRLLVKPVWKALSSFAGRVTRLFATDCYNEIASRNPGMDDASSEAVLSLCDNTVQELVVQDANLNPQGIEAISQALRDNTGLVTLRFSRIYCNTPIFAGAIMAGLAYNRYLRNLFLDVADETTTFIRPTPMFPQAVKAITAGLPCTPLRYINFGSVDFNKVAGQQFATTLTNQTYFPLTELFLSWYDYGQSVSEQFSLLLDGFRNNQCLTSIGIGTYALLSDQKILSLLQAIGNSTVSTVDLWCRETLNFNPDRILPLIQNATCLRNFTFSARNCFSSALTASFEVIFQNRASCERSPLCDVPLNCTDPLVVATPSQSANITQNLYFQVPVAIGGTLALVASTVLWRRRSARQAGEIAAANMDTLRLEGAGQPEELPIPRESQPTEGEV